MKLWDLVLDWHCFIMVLMNMMNSEGYIAVYGQNFHNFQHDFPLLFYIQISSIYNHWNPETIIYNTIIP